MILENFPQDLVLLVLTKCDVVTILKLEQVCAQNYRHCTHRLTLTSPKTCRYIREISLSRHLWLTLVQELDFDQAPNIPPFESIKSMSSERLRDIVLQATRCYLNWTSPEGPKVTRSLALIAPENRSRYAPALDMLVPGGRYYVHHIGDGVFYCRDTLHCENYYSYQIPSYAGEIIRNLDCILVDDGTALIMAFIICRNLDEM